jgi:predicted MFS family arabinose efflux permease
MPGSSDTGSVTVRLDFGGPLRERNFRLLASARTISFFGTNLAPIAVAFAVLDLTGSATDVGIAFACWTLAQVSTLLVGGVVADRLPRRLVMLSSDSANFVIRVTMGVLLVSGHARIWELFVLQALGGAATAFYSPASTGLVPETVRPALLQQANAIMGVSRYLAFPVGAAAGGAIVATIGSGYALLVDGATYATSALLLSLIHLPGRAGTAASPNFVRELREGWQAFTEHTWVWLLTGWISFYFLITYAPFFVLGPYIAKHSLGGVTAWAIIVTGEAIGSLGGAIAGLRFRPRRAMVAIGALFMVTALQCALLAMHSPALAIGAAATLAGFAFSYGTVIWDTSLQLSIAPDKLARVSAYNWMGAMAFLPAGYAIAGPLASAIGMSTSLWIGVIWVIASTLAVLSVRGVREFRLQPAQPEAEPAAAIAVS